MHRFHAFACRLCAVLLVLLLCSCATTTALAATTTSGEQKTAVILVNFQDRQAQPLTRAAAGELVFGQVSDFYWEASYQRTFFSGEVFGWFTLPVSSTVCDVHLIAREADKAATAAGADLAAYDRLVYLAPQNSCAATGYNNGSGVTPSRTWLITDSINMQVVAHELGHNFGLSHSQALDCGASVLGGSCMQYSYGDAADTMGSGVAPHFNAFQKEKLGWLGASGQPSILAVAASGTYQIAPLETAGTAPKALKIPRGTDPLTGQVNYYYVEYRQPIGFDAVLASVGNLAQGVLVHTGGPSRADGLEQQSMLLDMTPDSDAASVFRDIRDGALVPGSSYVDSVAGVGIKLVSIDAGGATVAVTVGGASVPACTRAAPVMGIAGPAAATAAGTTLQYAVSISNQDGSACPATTFNLAASLPAGWSGTLAASSLSLSPGATGSTTLAVTSAPAATAGSYGLGVGAGSSAGSVHTASASSTYVVAAPATLSAAVGTDKTSYARAETVRMSALVKSDGVAVAAATVKFTVTLPNGSTAVVDATTGSDGYARASYKVGKGKTAVGAYAVRADATSAGNTATGSTGFSVR